jgi:hypothetical protein
MIRYQTQLELNSKMVVYIFEDLLKMRIFHEEELLVNYHSKLIQCAAELLVSRYPKHLYPIASYCFQRGFYSQNMIVKNASISALKICETIVKCQIFPSNRLQFPVREDLKAGLVEEKESVNDADHSKTLIALNPEDFLAHKETLQNHQTPTVQKIERLEAVHLVIEKESNLILNENQGIDDFKSSIFSKVENNVEEKKNPKSDINESPERTAWYQESQKILKAESIGKDDGEIAETQDETTNDNIQAIAESDVSEDFSIPEINLDSSDDES